MKFFGGLVEDGIRIEADNHRGPLVQVDDALVRIDGADVAEIGGEGVRDQAMGGIESIPENILQGKIETIEEAEFYRRIGI
jgi:hypothetical protein